MSDEEMALRDDDADNINSELAHLFKSLKMPAAHLSMPRLTQRARQDEISYEHFTQMLLESECSARDASGGRARITRAHFPSKKTLEEFDFTFQRSIQKTVIQHLSQLDFIHSAENVVLLGPPGTGKTHLAISLGIRACLSKRRVLFASAMKWITHLEKARNEGKLSDELKRLARIPLIIIDEVGYIPFDKDAANLMFALISDRYEKASLILTSNKPFSQWGEIFGDETVAAAMIDRLVHHAHILSLKGQSYRLKDKDLGASSPPKAAVLSE